MPQLKMTEAVDPVCGMTVMPNASTLHLEHDGVTYYFCCSGCHRAFSETPQKYVKAATR